MNGATTVSTISPSGLSHLVHCGLNLLHNLPASKDAVFEYFTIFFDASVAGYVKLMEVRETIYYKTHDNIAINVQSICIIYTKTNHFNFMFVFCWISQQKDPNLVASYDNTVAEVQDVLETLLNQGQHAWVPYISTWSIKTLGVLSKKYKRPDNRGKLWWRFDVIFAMRAINSPECSLLATGVLNHRMKKKKRKNAKLCTNRALFNSNWYVNFCFIYHHSE